MPVVLAALGPVHAASAQAVTETPVVVPMPGPALGPAPDWVVAHGVPDDGAGVAPLAPSGSGRAAAVRLLLDDQQVRFAGGETAVYHEFAYRIVTPQGLGAGAITLNWNPATEVLTVHKLVIRRGDKVIDVLAGGQHFTVARRDRNPDAAGLNGALTASIQPEGLQLGDVIDYAASVSHRDPLLRGHYETMVGSFARAPVGLLALAVQWPAATDLHWQTHGLPPLKRTTHGPIAAIALQLADAQPVIAPKGAPPRYAQGRSIAFSDYASWAEVSALFAPWYAKAATLAPGSPLAAEVARIAAVSPDPRLRAAAALTLVQDRVRSVAIAMGEAGLVPADADLTWRRHFGDSQGKTALLLALLDRLGITAQPALANIRGTDGLDADVPMIGRFNHVLVRATIAGRVYWLDPSQTGDNDLDAIEPPPFGWVLPVQPAHAVLERIIQTPLAQPQVEKSLTLDASAGLSLPAPAHAEQVIHGRAAMIIHDRLGTVAGPALDAALRAAWRKEFPAITITSVSHSFDAAGRSERLVMDGTATMAWRDGRYALDHSGVGYQADFARAPGPDADAPYLVGFPEFIRVTETIRLPDQGRGFAISPDAAVDQTLAGTQWQRMAGIADGVATVTKSLRSLVPEFPAADAPAAQQGLRDLARRAVFIMQTAPYHRTAPELAAMLAKPPVTPGDYVERGDALIEAGRYQAAVAMLDQAVAKTDAGAGAGTVTGANGALALAERGIAQDALGHAALAAQDFAKARDTAGSAPLLNDICWRKATLRHASPAVLASALADCDAALGLLPGAAQIMDSRGLVLLRLGRDAEAVAQYDRALALDASLATSRYGRALAEGRSGQVAAQTRDLAAARASNPAIGAFFADFGVGP